jgi:hypothetical protein
MVYAGYPANIEALSPLCASENVGKGVAKRMAHMEIARDIRRRQGHRKRLFIGGRLPLENTLFFP